MVSAEQKVDEGARADDAEHLGDCLHQHSGRKNQGQNAIELRLGEKVQTALFVEIDEHFRVGSTAELLTRGFEPAIELYSGEDAKALGPAFVGNIRTGGKTKLHWELGVYFGLDNESADQTFRGLLEFEF